MVIDLKSGNNKYERTETLKRYYEDIRKFNVLSVEEEKELFKTYRFGTKIEKDKAREIITNSNLRLVVSVAKKYGNDDNILDLINEGSLGLLEAIDSFDYEKAEKVEGYKDYGCGYIKFSSYAIWYIRRAINFYLQNNGALVKKSNISKTYHNISRATNKFIQTEQREPTAEELFEILNEEYGVKIQDVKDITATRFTSIDESVDDDDACNIGDINMFNTTSASTNAYELEATSDYNKLLLTSLLDGLSDRDQNILKMSFGIDCFREYTNEEVAEAVGLTKERVRQIIETTIAKLHKEAKKRFNAMR